MFKLVMNTTMMLTLLVAGATFAKDVEPKIIADNAHLPAELTINIAKTAVAMGVKEPLTIDKDGTNAKLSGSSSTVCIAKLSGDEAPKMLGISCK